MSMLALLVVSIVLCFSAPAQLDPSFLKLSLWQAAAVLLFQVAYRATGPRPINWLCIDLLFMLAYGVTHLSYVGFWLIEWVPPGKEIWQIKSIKPYVCFATQLSVVGMAAFATGFNVLRDCYARVRTDVPIDVRTLSRWRDFGKVLLAIGAASGLTILMTLGPDALEEGYEGTHFDNYAHTMLFAIARKSITIGAAVSIIALMRLRKRKSLGLFVPIVLTGYVLIMLIHGDRQAMLDTTFIVLLGWGEYVRPMKFRWVVLGLLFGSLVFAIARAGRQAPSRDPISIAETAIANSEEVGFESGAMEVSGTVKTLYVACKVFPKQHDYYYGKLHVPAIAAMVPWGFRIVTFLHGGEWDPREVSSPILLTYHLTGRLPRYEGNDVAGAGSTCVADIYLNYGMLGVVTGFFLFGMVCKLFEQRMRSSGSMLWEVSYLFMVPAVLYACRSSLPMVLVRDLWRSVVVLLIAMLVLGLRSKVTAVSWPRPRFPQLVKQR